MADYFVHPSSVVDDGVWSEADVASTAEIPVAVRASSAGLAEERSLERSGGLSRVDVAGEPGRAAPHGDYRDE